MTNFFYFIKAFCLTGLCAFLVTLVPSVSNPDPHESALIFSPGSRSRSKEIDQN